MGSSLILKSTGLSMRVRRVRLFAYVIRNERHRIHNFSVTRAPHKRVMRGRRVRLNERATPLGWQKRALLQT